MVVLIDGYDEFALGDYALDIFSCLVVDLYGWTGRRCGAVRTVQTPIVLRTQCVLRLHVQVLMLEPALAQVC